MSYTLDGIGLISGHVTYPSRGTWSADVEVNTDQSMGGARTLALPGGLELKGYVVGGGVTAGRQRLKIFGGAGGLSRSIKGQAFRQAAVRTIVEYLLNAAGETLATDSDAAILSRTLAHWTHRQSACGQGLELLCAYLGTRWSVKPDGSVRVGDPDWLEVTPDHILVGEDLSGGRWTIVSESSILPGSSFLGKRVESVEHVFQDEEARQHILWGSDGHPFDYELKQAVQRLQHRTLPLYAAEVVSQAQDGSLDLKPQHSEVGPGWQGVPLYLVGTSTVKVVPGARCIVEFLDNDPTQPFVRSFLAGTFTEISETATTKIEMTSGEMKLKGNSSASLDGPSVAIGKTAATVGLGPIAAKSVAAFGDAVAAGAISGTVNQVVKV